MIREIETKLAAIDHEFDEIIQGPDTELSRLRTAQLRREREELLDACANLPAEDRVFLARHAGRPGIADYIENLFEDFFEQHGDRNCREDASILGGVALYKGRPVTVIGHRKGRDLAEKMRCNFGMPGPEGYRKAQRLLRQAEKFKRPVITFVDTAGAYPGLEAEAHGQGEAIASTLALMSSIDVPVICVVTGEGGSGGALALAVGNRVLMLENAVYSVLSPEGFASILWKDATKSETASRLMKLTAQDLLQLGVIDEIIPEPPGGAHQHASAVLVAVDRAITRHLDAVTKAGQYAQRRYKKFRAMGNTPPAREEER